MTDDNNDDVDDGNLDDTLSEILGTLSRVATSHDLDLAFGAVDVNVDLACTSLLSPLSHLPPPTSHLLSSFFYCCWGAHLRSKSFHYLFPLLVSISLQTLTRFLSLVLPRELMVEIVCVGFV